MKTLKDLKSVLAICIFAIPVSTIMTNEPSVEQETLAILSRLFYYIYFIDV